MPKWERPSLPLNVSEAEAESIAGKLVDAVQHAPERRSRASHRQNASRSTTEVKDWFLDLVKIQRERLGWNYMTFCHSQLVAPYIFGGMNVSVPKRWKYSEAFGSGSAKRVLDAVYTLLHEILKAAASKVPVSTSFLQLLVNKELERLGFESVSGRWVRRFMHQREMSFRKHVIRLSLKFSGGWPPAVGLQRCQTTCSLLARRPFFADQRVHAGVCDIP